MIPPWFLEPLPKVAAGRYGMAEEIGADAADRSTLQLAA
jgi:hypothetical protein